MTHTTTPLDPAARRVVTWRSILLGLAGVLFICGLTPYNDYVVNNTYLVGNFLPIGLLLFFIVVVMVINAPLNLWARRYAFSTGELAVALSMALISCGLPSSGLMRYLPGTLVGTWVHANTGNAGNFRATLQESDLPTWLFPTMTLPDRYGGVSDEVISNFYNATPGPKNTLADRIAAVPWTAWIPPAIGWGVFIACLYGTIFCLAIIVRRQWVENERLAFPLASVYLSLVEQPEPGRALNGLFRSPIFWVAAGLVFVVHGINAMHQYWPSAFPEVPIKYELQAIFANDPWRVVDWSFKAASIMFVIVGIVYFIQSNIAFSLFFTYLIMAVPVRMIYNTYGTEFPTNGHTDLMFGATFPFVATILWVGRHHWAMVIRQMFRGEREGEPAGRYLSYRAAGWGAVLCLAGVFIWLRVIGVTVGASSILVGMYFLIIVATARIVSETGLIFMQINVPLGRPWSYLLAGGFRGPVPSYLGATLVGAAVGHEFRENIGTFAMHSLRTVDEAAYDRTPPRRRAVGFALCLIAAVVVGYLVSGASMLYAEYNHAVTLDNPPTAPINHYVIRNVTTGITETVASYKSTSTIPTEAHSRSSYFGAGFGITAVLSYLRLRYVSWPFHPIGFLLATSYPMKRIWFSLMIGWLAKVLIVRFGGTNLYRAARPAFIGLIIGEAGAAAFWLVVSLVRVSMGLDYTAIRLLPT